MVLCVAHRDDLPKGYLRKLLFLRIQGDTFFYCSSLQKTETLSKKDITMRG